MDKKYYNASDIAKIIHRSRERVRQLMNEFQESAGTRGIPHFLKGRSRYSVKEDLDFYFAHQKRNHVTKNKKRHTSYIKKGL